MRIKIDNLRNQRFCVVVVFTGEKICIPYRNFFAVDKSKHSVWIYRQQKNCGRE